MKQKMLAATLGCLVCAGASFAAEEKASTAKDQTALSITIYNSDLALVKDARRVRLRDGNVRLAWRDVSARIQPETALLRSLDGRRMSLMEQNFDFDLLTPAKLLEKVVGETIRIVRTHPVSGAETVEEARVLSANGGAVLKFADRIETDIPGRMVFSTVPSHLRDVPTLSMLCRSDTADEQGVELSYLTSGLSWKADYVAELSGKEDALDLTGWATLSNVSGTAYRDAVLQLVAGDVNRVRPKAERRDFAGAVGLMAQGAEMQEESLFDYHLYTLDRPTTILDQQTKQVGMLSAQGVPVRKRYILPGKDHDYRHHVGSPGADMKIGVYMEFANRGANLGAPLPAGVIRVYKRDSQGRAQFLGEDRIGHVPKGETVRLRLGNAFDVTADKKQVEFTRVANPVSGKPEGIFESAFAVEIRNARSEPVVVTVIEPMPGDWQITRESQPHRKADAHSAIWDVTVPAEGKAALTWKARVKL